MMIIKNKIETKELIFFLTLFLLLTLFTIARIEFVGLLSLIIVSFVTYYFSIKYRSLAIILYFALCFRLFIIFLGNYWVVLPDSWGDATYFEFSAWQMSQDGFFLVFDKFPYDKSSLYISWVLAFFYSVTERSVILGQSLSLLFGIGSLLLGSRIAHKMYGEKASIKVAWIIALYPSLVLYSTLILRESYIWFFLLLAIYGIICWLKDENLKSIIITIIGFFGATFYHGGMFFGGLIFLFYIILSNFIKIFKSLFHFKISVNSLVILVLSLSILSFMISNSALIPKIGSLLESFNPESIIKEISDRTINRAGFPEWTIPKSSFELIYKAPIRVIYFMFSPFPWDVTIPSHLFGLCDGLFHIFLFILLIKNFKTIWSDKTLKIILIILFSYLALYGLASGNFGTGLRHRTKFLILTMLLVLPWIPNIVLKKKKY